MSLESILRDALEAKVGEVDEDKKKRNEQERKIHNALKDLGVKNFVLAADSDEHDELMICFCGNRLEVAGLQYLLEDRMKRKL